MSYPTLLSIAQIVLAVLLVTVILLQQRGTGLGAAFGGGDDNVFATRRGAERIIFIATIVFAVLFIAAAIAQHIIR